MSVTFEITFMSGFSAMSVEVNISLSVSRNKDEEINN